MDQKEFIKTHQQKIALLVGYLLVAALGFGLGRLTAFTFEVPEIQVEQEFTLPALLNNTSNSGSVQSATTNTQDATATKCEGKIKGNIGSTGLIYHVPGGSFYNRTNAETCFDTEAEAQAAGYRRSLR